MTKQILIADHRRYKGCLLGVSAWQTIQQYQVDQFAELAGDQQWIHTDVDRAARDSPFGSTIVHGYFILAFAPKLMEQVFQVTDATMGVNRGFNKLRFISPLKVGSAMRLQVEVLTVDEQPGYSDVLYGLTFLGQDMVKPICVAELLKRWVADQTG